MADAAMRIGHTGNLIDDAVFMLRSAIDGQSVPIVVRVDPMAVATRVRQLVDTTPGCCAGCAGGGQGGAFTLGQSTPGSDIDERLSPARSSTA